MAARRVLVIGGGSTSPSHTSGLMNAVGAAIAERGAEVAIWDLAKQPVIPVETEAMYAWHEYKQIPAGEHPGRKLIRLARRADAIVLASPVYHHSFAGHLKTALDVLTRVEVEGKPVGLVSTSGSRLCTQAVDQLRIVVRSLHAFAILEQVVAQDTDFILGGGEYRLASREMAARIDAMVDQLLTFSKLLRDRNGQAGSYLRSPLLGHEISVAKAQ